MSPWQNATGQNATARNTPRQNVINIGICFYHRLRIQILQIFKFTKIREFLGILKLSVLELIKFKLSHSLPQVPTNFSLQTQLLNFGLKILSCQQFKICQLVNSSAWSRAAYYKVYESSAASLSSPVSESQSSTAHCSHSTVVHNS